MKALTQDNDTWQPLGLAAQRLLVKLGEDHQADRERDTREQRSEEDKSDQHRKAVNEGLRQIERFEARYRRADRS